MDEDVAFIKDVVRWPMFPMLPVKRRDVHGGAPELGLIVAYDLRRVFLLSIDELPQHPYRDFAEMREKHPSVDYPNTEELVAAGWIVD